MPVKLLCAGCRKPFWEQEMAFIGPDVLACRDCSTIFYEGFAEPMPMSNEELIAGLIHLGEPAKRLVGQLINKAKQV
jgi:hypothetical protein